MRRSCLQVGVERNRDLIGLDGARTSDERRLFDDASSAVAQLGEPRQGPVAGAPPGSLSGSFDLLAQRIPRRRQPKPVEVEPLVGAGE